MAASALVAGLSRASELFRVPARRAAASRRHGRPSAGMHDRQPDVVTLRTGRFPGRRRAERSSDAIVGRTPDLVAQERQAAPHEKPAKLGDPRLRGYLHGPSPHRAKSWKGQRLAGRGEPRHKNRNRRWGLDKESEKRRATTNANAPGLARGVVV